MFGFTTRAKQAATAKAQTDEEKYFALIRKAIERGDLNDAEGAEALRLAGSLGRDCEKELATVVEYRRLAGVYGEGVDRKAKAHAAGEAWGHWTMHERMKLEKEIEARENALQRSRQLASANYTEAREAYDRLKLMRETNDPRLFAGQPDLVETAVLWPGNTKPAPQVQRNVDREQDSRVILPGGQPGRVAPAAV